MWRGSLPNRQVHLGSMKAKKPKYRMIRVQTQHDQQYEIIRVSLL